MNKSNETLHSVCHKGISGYSSVVARSDFRFGGQETAPKSISAHTLDHYSQCKKNGHFKNITMKTTKSKLENFRDSLIEKWQEINDVIAEIIDIPAVLIMKTENESMDFFISSH